METYTTETADGRNLELEIVQNAPRGYAVNFHQLDTCVGRIDFHAEGYEAMSDFTESGQEIALGVFGDRFEALQAIVEHLSRRLEEVEETVPVDPADADGELMDRLDAEVYAEHYSAAARRDILRRAAFDMGVQDRRAHPAMLPVIADAAAKMIRDEMEPQLRQVFKDELADTLAAEWTPDHRKTAYTHRTVRHASFSFSMDAETIKLYAGRPGGSTVETLTLDRDRTSAERVARIIGAIFE